MKVPNRILALVLAAIFTVACSLSALPLSQSNAAPALQNTPVAPAAPATAPAAAPAAQEFTVPKITNDTAVSLDSTMEGIFNRVSPSVVYVQSLLAASPQTNTTGRPRFNTAPSAPEEVSGSGFVWDDAGHIITNNHVVDGATRVVVFFPDGTEADAKVIAADKNSDLAVLQVTVAKDLLKPVTMGNSDTVKVGELAIAIGYPFALDITMTKGIISGLARTIPVAGAATGQPTYTIPDLIQTDAPINPGNSGGVLVNENAEVIGITNAIESPVGASVGVGFAIPAAIVERVIPRLITDGKYVPTFIGIQGVTLTSDLANAMNLDPATRGILLETVDQNGPAAAAGLRGSTKQATISGVDVAVGGDLITAINGQPMKQIDDLISYLFRYTDVGQKVTVTVIRDGKTMNLDVTLAARP